MARDLYEFAAPSAAIDDEQVALFARYLALAASPGSAIALRELWDQTDISAVLPAVAVPCLVLARTDAPRSHPEIARWVASSIPGARLVEVPGRDLAPWIGDVDALADEVETFVTGVRPGPYATSVLATLLFTDIVGSTERQASLGDQGWRDLVVRHHDVVRAQLAIYHGKEMDTAGDGFYAIFDGPARAVRCALDIAKAVRALGIEIRAGVPQGSAN